MDIVVTVPKHKWKEWLVEGHRAGDDHMEPVPDQEYFFKIGTRPPRNIAIGDRVYIVCNVKLRGYAPLVRIDEAWGAYFLVRCGGAVAVTIDEKITGFRGFRYRWWDLKDERPLHNWFNLKE